MLNLLVDLLPANLRGKAKALVAGAGSALLAAVATGLAFGQWDRAAIVGAAVGLLIGPATFATPNK